ncbi:hypothetical protein DBR28_18570 [Chryseobacterium sp. HMWF028]|nr:hypothetical protein DBR28_18570 [Chryseobacterium sp. HMWF028]
MNESRLDILNPDADGKQRLYNKEGKTTLKNLRYLRSDNEVEALIFDLSLLVPSTLLSFVDTDVIRQYLKEDLEQKHSKILRWLKSKHFWIETGEDVEKSEDFIREFFNYNYSLDTFRRKLRKYQFSTKEISKYYSRMGELNNEMDEK